MLEAGVLACLLAMPWLVSIVAYFENRPGNRVIPCILTWIITQGVVCFLIVFGAVIYGLLREVG